MDSFGIPDHLIAAPIAEDWETFNVSDNQGELVQDNRKLGNESSGRNGPSQKANHRAGNSERPLGGETQLDYIVAGSVIA